MNQTVPIIDISKVEHSSKIDFFDDDFVIFDDLNEIPLFDYPSRIADAAVFAICQKGSVRISINLKEYTIVPNNLVVLLPDQIVQHTNAVMTLPVFSWEYPNSSSTIRSRE